MDFLYKFYLTSTGINFRIFQTLIKADINPKIIDDAGKCQLEENMKNFSKSDKDKINEKFSCATYFAISDQKCSSCKSQCDSNLKAFDANDGEYLPENAKKLGAGGFGTVLEGIWHGIPAAFKSVLIRKKHETGSDSKDEDVVGNTKRELDKDLAEMKNTEGLSESYFLRTIGHYRQQIRISEENMNTGSDNNDSDDNADKIRFVCKNYEIFVMKKCNCDLVQFQEKYQPSGEFLKFILLECLKRKFLKFNVCFNHMFIVCKTELFYKNKIKKKIKTKQSVSLLSFCLHFL